MYWFIERVLVGFSTTSTNRSFQRPNLSNLMQQKGAADQRPRRSRLDLGLFWSRPIDGVVCSEPASPAPRRTKRRCTERQVLKIMPYYQQQGSTPASPITSHSRSSMDRVTHPDQLASVAPSVQELLVQVGSLGMGCLRTICIERAMSVPCS